MGFVDDFFRAEPTTPYDVIASGSINDLPTVDLSGSAVSAIRFTGATPTVTGLVWTTSRPGQRIHLMAIGGPLVLANESASSLAPNRIATGVAGGANATIPQGGACWLLYDATSQRWRLTHGAGGGGGSGTTPTGTGLRKVAGGVENAAASLLVNADVDAAAAIALTKLAAPANGTFLGSDGTTISGTNRATSYGVGNNVLASVGGLRLDTNAQKVIAGRNTANTGDVEYVSINASNGLYLGTDESFSAGKQAGSINMYASSGGLIALGKGSTTMIYMPGANVEFWAKLQGGVALAMALRGEVANVTQSSTATTTLTAAQFTCPEINITGTPGGAFAVVAPLQAGSFFDVWNGTPSTMTFGGSSGATVSIPTLTKARCVCFDGANYR